MRKVLVFGLMIGTVAAWNTGCSGDDDDDDHPVPVSIAISGGTAVNVGSNLQLTATATFDDASTEDVTLESAWTTNSAANATVGPSTGLVTGVSTGPATITATHDGVPGSVTVTVGTSAGVAVNLTFNGAGWTAHNGVNAYVRILEGTTQVFCQESTVIASGAWSVSGTGVLIDGHSYTFETFADSDANDEWNTLAGEHRWTGNITASGNTTNLVNHGDTQAGDLTWPDNAGCT